MTLHIAEISPLRRARLAGFLYLMLFPAVFSLIYIPGRLIVHGNAAATAGNILASELLFRVGIVTNLLLPIINLLVAVALYQLLKPVNKTMAALMVIFVVMVAPITMLNELNQLGVLLLLKGAAYLNVFPTDQLQALAMFLLNLHSRGAVIVEIFSGLWLFPMGYLVFKSGFIPRLLGVLLVIGSVGYVTESLAAFLWPSLNLSLIFYTSWGELLLPLWLLIKGVNVEVWKKRAQAAA
jgi:hypothetical protein